MNFLMRWNWANPQMPWELERASPLIKLHKSLCDNVYQLDAQPSPVPHSRAKLNDGLALLECSAAEMSWLSIISRSRMKRNWRAGGEASFHSPHKASVAAVVFVDFSPCVVYFCRAERSSWPQWCCIGLRLRFRFPETAAQIHTNSNEQSHRNIDSLLPSAL